MSNYSLPCEKMVIFLQNLWIGKIKGNELNGNNNSFADSRNLTLSLRFGRLPRQQEATKMANRTDRNPSRDLYARHESGPNLFASAKPGSSQHHATDDVIASLANARENRRARQVTEWERMRRQNFRAAIL